MALTALGKPRTPPEPTPEVRRDFRIYFTGQISASFGAAFTSVAVAVAAVQTFNATPIQMGLLAAASTVPTLVLGPLAGVVADRTRRPRRLLIVSDLFCALILSGCAAALAAGVANLVWLVAFSVLLGTGSLVTQALFFTHVNSLGVSDLATVRARLQAGTYVAGAVSNAVVGPVVAAFGAVVGLLVDLFSYLTSAACLRSLRAPDRNPAREPVLSDVDSSATRPPSRAELTVGFRTLGQPQLRPIALYALIAQTGFVGCSALRPLFLLDTLALPVSLFAVPAFCAAALGVVGSVYAGRALRAGVAAAPFLVGCWLMTGLSGLLLPVAGGSHVTALALACAGTALPVMGGAAANVAFVALLTQSVPEQVIGRVTAAILVLLTASATAGPILAGWLASGVGVRTAIWCSAAAVLAGLPLLRSLVRPQPIEPKAVGS
jgi:MFS family permease